MSATTAEQLRKWAERQKSERAEFAVQLAGALDDPKQAGPWSLLDIRREFESRSGRATSPVSSLWRLGHTLVRALLLAGYLVPVLVTWIDLRSVVRSFAAFEAANAGDGGPSVNLLTFWSGGYNNAYSGTPLADTATKVFIIISVLIALQILVSVADDYLGNELEIPHNLVLEAQLHFARTRAMTPQEVTEVMSAASKQLSLALEDVATTVETATGLVSTVGEASTQLENASKKLGEMMTTMGEAVKPLEDLGVSLKETNTSIQASTRALDSARVSVVGVTGGFKAIEDSGRQFRESVEKAGDGLQSSVESIGRESTELSRQVKDVSAAVAGAAARMAEVVKGIGEAGRLLGEFSVMADAREPHIAVSKKIVDSMHDVAQTVVASVNELKRALELNHEVNENIAVEVRRVLGDGGGDQ